MFNPFAQDLDLKWLSENGWTYNSNLAYRHILHDFAENKSLTKKQITAIICKYNAENRTAKIIEALEDLVSLKNDLNVLYTEIANNEKDDLSDTKEIDSLLKKL
ncbi:MAG: hypothetical protein WBM44_10365 [Waterburya sp.]